ncbi:DinB family protein [Micromonospora pisi]|uniref:DinB family protein n=1 Tax=Micromonospora pisi TaxID=589240 RepID=A0A495JT31_9ACTN|nr:DinB family protein [Micromonospora pisi]RKR92150.1 DinB family protein [Micromonospora pisi]
MSPSRTELLRWQFDLTWSLLDYHLDRLESTDLLWEPAELCWTVRPDATGVWVPDWSESEPDPIPVPTIAWITWHLGWWWSVTLDHVEGRAPRDRTDVGWPGDLDGTITWLRGLRTSWVAVLDRLGDEDLDRPATFPWQAEDGHPVARMVAWVNAELMKNSAEIGQLRLLRAAGPTGNQSTSVSDLSPVTAKDPRAEPGGEVGEQDPEQAGELVTLNRGQGVEQALFVFE